MIIVVLRGGLGNQMYEYASARAMAMRAGTDLVLNTRMGFETDKEYNRKYCLDCFNIQFLKRRFLSFDFPAGRYFESLSRKVGVHVLAPWYKVLFDKEANVEDMKENPHKYRNILMQGIWNRNDAFFDDNIKQIVSNDFRLQWELPEIVKEYKRKIESSSKPVIALGIRVFQDVKNRGQIENGRQLPPEASYIANAMNWYVEKFGDVKFMVFTQVPKWLYDNVQTNLYDFEIVDTGGDDTTAIFDMYLFSLCNHFILTNSTFYAWGEKLNNNSNKFVVIPQSWSLSAKHDWIRL